MLTRRQLLKRSAVVSLSPLVPSFLARAARAAEAERDRKILVVVQLSGGNDGLNTVVPYRDEHYAQLRPKLKLADERLIKLNDELALNKSLEPLAARHEAGRLCIVQGVGYPNPNRSHFESMAIWHAARLEQAELRQYGWLGRTLDLQAASSAGPHAVYASGDALPAALWARRGVTAMIPTTDSLRLDAPAALLQASCTGDQENELARQVAAASRDAFTTCERLAPALPPASNDATATSRLGSDLATIAALIKADTPARVYYAAQGGYDTHAGQEYEHLRLLRTLGRELDRFLADLEASGLSDRVLVMAFSEFGRRAAENASIGTDHGAAAPVLLAGPAFTSGIVGPTSNLAELVDGDVPMAIDFRSVYATLLEKWLEVDAAAVLGATYEPLAVLPS